MRHGRNAVIKIFGLIAILLLTTRLYYLELRLGSVVQVLEQVSSDRNQKTLCEVKWISNKSSNTSKQEAAEIVSQSADQTSPYGGFHIITLLSIFNGDVWPHYENFTQKERDDRDREVIETLANNLNRSEIKKIHLFYIKDHEMEAILKLGLYNSHKILPVKRDRLIHMADFFTYASLNLVDEPVIAMNSDIAIGDGFEKIDTIRLRDNRMIFSLTRYGDEGETHAIRIVNCDNKRYRGSHDTHVFRLAEPLNATSVFSKLDFPTNMWQAENAMIYVMQIHFKFKVRNPCPIVRTYHRHISPVHGSSDQKTYTVRDLPPFNITAWMVWKSGYGYAYLESKLNYTNPNIQ